MGLAELREISPRNSGKILIPPTTTTSLGVLDEPVLLNVDYWLISTPEPEVNMAQSHELIMEPTDEDPAMQEATAAEIAQWTSTPPPDFVAAPLPPDHPVPREDGVGSPADHAGPAEDARGVAGTEQIDAAGEQPMDGAPSSAILAEHVEEVARRMLLTVRAEVEKARAEVERLKKGEFEVEAVEFVGMCPWLPCVEHFL